MRKEKREKKRFEEVCFIAVGHSLLGQNKTFPTHIRVCISLYIYIYIIPNILIIILNMVEMKKIFYLQSH